MATKAIKKTEGILIYPLKKGFFIKPPTSIRELVEVYSNGRVWAKNYRTLIKYIKRFKRLKNR